MGSLVINGVERQLNLRPSLPDVHDYRFQAQVDASQLQDTYDISLGWAYDQALESSCTGNAQAKLFRAILKAQGMPDWQISRAMIYFNGRKLEGTTAQDSGSTIADSMAGIAKWGACSESRFPYVPGDYAHEPDASCYAEALDHQVLSYGLVGQTADAIRAALDANHPVSIGWVVYNSINSMGPDGVLPMPAGGVAGAHDTLITGCYHSRRLFICDNSWLNWGITLSGTPSRYLMPYDYVLNPQLCFELKTMTQVEGLITPPPAPPAPDELAQLYADITRILGPIDSVGIHFTHGQAWPLVIQAPR